MKKLSILLLSFCGVLLLNAQDDLLGDLLKEDAAKPKQNIVTSTFKGTRLINSQTTEMTGVGNIAFMVLHRFAPLTSMSSKNGGGFYNFLGLQSARTYLTVDYTPIKWLNIALNYAPQTATVDGALKFQIIRQQSGIKNIPLTIDIFADMFVKTGPFTTSQGSFKGGEQFTDRLSYMFQLLLARKFTDKFSLQLMPTMVHYNAAPTSATAINDIYSIGIGGRYKFTERIALTLEYFRQLNGYLAKTNGVADYAPDFLSLGVEFDTGGHIFQLFVSNSQYVTSPTMFTNSNNSTPFYKGNVSIGFNLNRAFGTTKKTPKTVE